MYLHDCSSRGGTKSLMFHANNTNAHCPACIIVVMTPCSCCVESEKLQNPQGISCSSTLVLNASHNRICLMWESPEFTLENPCWALLCIVYGNKSHDTAFLFVHEMLSYLLYCSINYGIFRNIKPCSPLGSFLNEVLMDILECGIISH